MADVQELNRRITLLSQKDRISLIQHRYYERILQILCDLLKTVLSPFVLSWLYNPNLLEPESLNENAFWQQLVNYFNKILT